jgi:hypothetical protein
MLVSKLEPLHSSDSPGRYYTWRILTVVLHVADEGKVHPECSKRNLLH